MTVINRLPTSLNGGKARYMMPKESDGHFEYKNIFGTYTPDTPFSFSDGYVVSIDREIYVIGGSTSGSTTTSNSFYKFDGKKWIPLNGISIKGGSAVVLNGEIHVLGDYNSPRYRYKWDGTKWEQYGDMYYEFYWGSAVVLNNEIHVLGGTKSRKNHYKWNGKTWSNVSTLPLEFYDGAAVVLNGEIHILGSSSYNYMHYKWNGETWAEASTLPYPFYEGESVVLNGEIHIVGSGYSTTSNECRRKHYKWNGSTWLSVSELPFDAYECGAVVLDEKVHLFMWNNYAVFDSGIWKSNTVIPKNMSYPHMISLNEEIHILGSNNSISQYKHFKWDKVNLKWIEASTLPTYNYKCGIIILGNEIHIINGSVHYKWDGTVWGKASDIPYQVNSFSSGSLVVLNDEIHMLGGEQQTTYHYKWNGSTWASVSTLPYSFYNGSAAVIDGEIHIFGSEQNSAQQNHYKWNGTVWSPVSNLPYKFYSGGIAVINREIHIFGTGDAYTRRNHYKWNGTVWSPVSLLESDFSGHGYAVQYGEIYLLNYDKLYIQKHVTKTIEIQVKKGFYVYSNLIDNAPITNNKATADFTISLDITPDGYLTILDKSKNVVIMIEQQLYHKAYLVTGMKVNGTKIVSNGLKEISSPCYIE